MNTKTSASKKTFILLLIGLFLVFLCTACVKLYRLYSLKTKLASFQGKIKSLEDYNQQLQEELKAVDDPVWLELALMEELGVIPEGAVKINYTED